MIKHSVKNINGDNNLNLKRVECKTRWAREQLGLGAGTCAEDVDGRQQADNPTVFQSSKLYVRYTERISELDLLQCILTATRAFRFIDNVSRG
jgi:hypothetical protein